ncbi:MAG: VTC domain-containing protein, partial [Bacteroidota bacterium]|nr:VTC domain-containing protein [Bacteroidota bacterium]
MHLLDFMNGRPHLGLEDIESVALMDRYDSKFLVPEHWLSHTLTQLPNHAVLSIANSLSTTYRNLYFDSADNVCVQQHVRGKTSRFKVRIRHYTNTEVTFLE